MQAVAIDLEILLKHDWSFILRRRNTIPLRKSSRKIIQPVESALETNVSNRKISGAYQTGSMLQAYLSQVLIRRMTGELFEEPAEMKYTYIAMPG